MNVSGRHLGDEQQNERRCRDGPPTTVRTIPMDPEDAESRADCQGGR